MAVFILSCHVIKCSAEIVSKKETLNKQTEKFWQSESAKFKNSKPFTNHLKMMLNFY